MARSANDDVVWERWSRLVNLDAEQLTDWLETEESLSVGSKAYGEESVGHAAGRRTADLIGVPREDLDPDDWRHVRRTVGFIRRHRAQWPGGDVTDTRWRWSLLNWGHDPLRDLGHSVLVVPIPGVEEYVRERTRFYDVSFLSTDPAFSHAHLTLLGPWLPEPGESDLARVEAIVAAMPAFDYTLAEVAAFPNGVIHLVPDDPSPFAALTSALVEAFPQCPPYDGNFPTPVPHVTLDRIGEGIDVDSVRGEINERLPAEGSATRVDLQWWANDDCHVLDSWELGKGRSW